MRFLSNSARVLASSNGLVLCCIITKQYPSELFICNPVTQSSSTIPTPGNLRGISYGDINVVLECNNHESLDDYSVFLFDKRPLAWSSSYEYCYECWVYRAKEGMWKRMKRNFLAGAMSMKFHMPVYYNGALHFISDYGSSYFTGSSPYSRPYIMSYNLHSGLSTTLELPREARFECGANMGIFRWGEVSSSTRSICLVRLRKSVFTVWFLRDYESGLWQRALKIRVRAMGIKEKDPKIIDFTVMNGDLLLFATKNMVYAYGLKLGDRYMRLEEIGEHRCGPHQVCFISYSDTFRSCGTEATPLQIIKKKRATPLPF